MNHQQVWGSHLSTSPNEANVLFCAGRDVTTLPMADAVLLPYDLWTNRAHAIMLCKQGIIPIEMAHSLLEGLNQIEDLAKQGKFELDPTKEDVHINVESFLTEKLGSNVGGRIHTARSRNDQAACDLRLYLRQACLDLEIQLLQFTKTLLKRVENPESQLTLPGFTHYQPAMLTSWGHWLCSYLQGLVRDLKRAEFCYQLLNKNPLGAAASFGSSWDIDRQFTTDLLGFDGIEINTLDCISSRGESEAQLVQVYAFVMNHFSMIAQDLIILSFPYVGIIEIDEAFVTGSSIMPQKKNPDFAEVIRSKAAYVQGALTTILGTQKASLSGYNRDSQQNKYLACDVIRECLPAATILSGVFDSLKLNPQRMQELCYLGFMNATDIADLLAQRLQIPFRDSYHILANAVKYSQKSGQLSVEALTQALEESALQVHIPQKELESWSDPEFLINCRTHVGSPSHEQIKNHCNHFNQELSDIENSINQRQQKIQNSYQQCLQWQF